MTFLKANINITVEAMKFLTLQVSHLHRAIARDLRFSICFHCNLTISLDQSLNHALAYSLSLCPGASGPWCPLNPRSCKQPPGRAR